VDTPKDYERARILYDALARLPGAERGRGELIIKVFKETLGPQDISIMEYIN
jgi:hypothetical protein